LSERLTAGNVHQKIGVLGPLYTQNPDLRQWAAMNQGANCLDTEGFSGKWLD
jgi:hypothetical protein